MDPFSEGFQRAGDDYDRAREWKNKLTLQAEQHTAAAKALQTEADRYSDTKAEKVKSDRIAKERADSAEKHAKKQDELMDAEIASIKKGGGKNGTGGNHASPALLNLREQYKQLSNDVRQKSNPGSHPPSDLIKRYNAVGKALNAQAKHEEPDSVQVDFVPIPETPPPASGASHFWTNLLSSSKPDVSTDDLSQYDK